MSQNQLCELIGLPRSTLSKYESGLFEPGGNALLKYTKHPVFSKYTMWLMTDEIAPSAGQIAPAFTHCGTDGGEAQKQNKKNGFGCKIIPLRPESWINIQGEFDNWLANQDSFWEFLLKFIGG